MSPHSVDFLEHRPHDVFDRGLDPVAAINPGDSVVFRTLDARWGRMAAQFGIDLPRIDLDGFEPRGHALCGPVYIRGARPGMVLAVRVDELVTERWGWTWAGPRPWNPRFDMGLDGEVTLGWDIDRDAGVARETTSTGMAVRLAPFMGVMGNAPSAPGSHPTQPPRRAGGNIDCRELQAGSTLYLPIEVDGALFSTGDGHAAQGDGEVGQTAIECSMARALLTFNLRNDLQIDHPQAETPAGYVTMGFGDTLDQAAAVAMDGMLGHLRRAYGLRRPEAMAISSVAVDLRVTQVVNGRMGVHALLPAGALSR